MEEEELSCDSKYKMKIVREVIGKFWYMIISNIVIFVNPNRSGKYPTCVRKYASKDASSACG